MRKNLLFIVPPCVSIAELTPDKNRVFAGKIRKEMPLGALSLATYMEKYTQSRVAVLDLNLKFYELVSSGRIDEINTPEKYIRDFICQLKDTKFDFCGISAIFSPTFGYLRIISDIVKEIFPDIVVVAGGGVPSNLMQEVFNNSPNIDIISYGEGEIGIAGFVNSENEQEYLEKSPSLMTYKKLDKGFRHSFEFVENLDDIPPLDFSLIEFEKYSSHVHAQDSKKVIAMPLMFSRGCPFNCCFCASHSIHGKKVRYNSLERIKSDIKLFADKYHVNTITVWDDNFFVDKERAIDLFDYFMKLNLKVEFVNGFPVYQMDDDMAKRLKMSGIDVVTLAIESGNPRVLKDIIHKPLKLEMVPRAIACLNKYDIYSKGLFVIGFPGETLDDIQMTMDFIHNSGLNWVDIFIASPLPGSELYDICRAGGYLKDTDLAVCDFWQGNIETENFGAGQIEEIQVYNTIKKDFVYNLDMKNQNWERALANFEYVINANHKNPFAYYYGAKAAEKIGMMDKAHRYFEIYLDIRKNNKEWERIFQKFESESVVFLNINESRKAECILL
ncbi:2-hydroxyethylphosphonate methyltransferase [Lachnospiraceae bacterium]|nr:2-hydroxyethylphosphonate methyltransferase [Lachnospiraceae bacterium]